MEPNNRDARRTHNQGKHKRSVNITSESTRQRARIGGKFGS